ncbi:hypothetical protein, partial [Halorhodospira sp. 9622]|uniref:hypothetical protein n=1 Tax=Halorhodospira sp. 9622 TaxID=2899136 RepID=UPI001EE7824B
FGRPTTQNIHEVQLEVDGGTANLDAQNMSGVEQFTYTDSDENLIVENIFGQPDTQTHRLQNIQPNSDYTALYDSGFDRDVGTLVLTIGSDATPELGEDDAENNIRINEVSFQVREVGAEEYEEVVLSTQAIQDADTYADLREAIDQAATDAGWDEIDVDLRENQSAETQQSAPYQITLSGENLDFQEGRWDADLDVPGDSDTVTRQSVDLDREGMIISNVELESVGSTSQGSEVNIAANDGSYRGVDRFEVETEGFVNLESLMSRTNNSEGTGDDAPHYLQEVELTGEG